MSEINLRAAVKIIAVGDRHAIRLTVPVRHAADEGNSGDGTSHRRESHVGVTVLKVRVAVLRFAEILKGRREAAAADASQVNEGSRVFIPRIITLYNLCRSSFEAHKIREFFGHNTLLERILTDLNFAAGIAVAHLAPHAAYQAAHADKVAPFRRDQFTIFIQVRAVDLNVHHSGASVQLKAGNADQTAYHRLAEPQFVLAVVLDLIARDGTVLDHRFARFAFIRILIGDTGQPAQCVGTLIVRYNRAALDDAAVVAVKHDVFDRRACRGAEYAHIVAVGIDGDVFDVVVPAVVLPAEPRVERNTVIVLIHTYRSGDGVERSVLFAVRRVFHVHAVDVMGLCPAPLGTSILRTGP